MLRLFLTVILSFLCSLQFYGQEKINQELSFVYISHDENTDTKALVTKLKDKYASIVNYPDNRAAVFYLANGNDPLIVRLNMPNDNREKFEDVIYSLQSKISHDVYPQVDVENIVALFNDNDIINDNGESQYRHIEWDYYINSTFWQLQNHEHLIAKLFFVMEMEKLISNFYLSLNFYYSRETDKIPYDEQRPFGSKAICSSIEFVPMPY